MRKDAGLALEWNQQAIEDLLRIVGYIAERDDEAAERFKDDVEERVSKLTLNPKRCRVRRVAGTREYVVHPNYIVVYTEDSQCLLVLRILHAAQAWPL